MTVQVGADDRIIVVSNDKKVIVTSNPKSSQIPRPYFYRWVKELERCPADMWPVKRGKPVTVSNYTNIPIEGHIRPDAVLVPISSMHTMRLVNTIKWCLKLATECIGKSSVFSCTSVSKAQLLAPIPQWRSLLAEAKSRRLKIITWEVSINGEPLYMEWYKDCMIAIMNKEF